MKLEDLPKIKLLIGIPTRGQFQADSALSLIWATQALTQNPVVRVGTEPHLITWSLVTVNSSNLSNNRQRIVELAKVNEATHLLFLDDDMTFPQTMLHEWFTADRPVIAANCPTRGLPSYPTARNRGGERGVPIYSDVRASRFEEVWRVGTGIMLLRKDALEALPVPAFTPRWNPDTQEYDGEDWIMAGHLEDAGIPICVDNRVSLEVGHIGTMTFTWNMVVAQRQRESRVIVEDGVITAAHLK